MKAHKDSMGEPWTKKHSALTLSMLQYMLCPIDITIPDMKEIIPFNLVRMGLATSRGAGIFRSAKFNVSWFLLSSETIHSKYTQMIDTLEDRLYGPFRLVSQVTSLEMAREVSRRGDMVERPIQKRVFDNDDSSVPSSSKRLCL